MRSLRRIIAAAPLKTVTVDVFDTVLLRKLYPEEWAFLLHARRVVPLLRERAGISISPVAFASLRSYLRRSIDAEHALQGFDREARVGEIFSLLVDFLLAVRGKTLPQDVRSEIADAFLHEEIALEKQSLRPNHHLLRILREAKATKGVRVYFLSDMYLSREHLQELFRHFGIADLFDDGATSSDLGYSKGTGRLYERVLRGGVIENFDPARNLHIGDSVHADVRSARFFAFCAIAWRKWHHRVYRPCLCFIGRTVVLWHQRSALRTWRRSLRKLQRTRERNLGNDQRVLYRLGLRCFGPALLHYIAYLSASAIATHRPVFFFSREAPFLKHLFRTLQNGMPQTTVEALPSLNRIALLRALGYVLLTQTEVRDSYSILSLFWEGEAKHNIEDFLQSIGVSREHLGMSELMLRQFRKHEFMRYISSLCDDEARGGLILEPMRQACNAVLVQLQRARFFEQQRLIVADVGWRSSMQILLEHIAFLWGKNPDVRGIYLGTVGRNLYGLPRQKNVEGVLFDTLEDETAKVLHSVALWEQVMIRGFSGELHFLRKGIEDCFLQWCGTLPPAPDILYQKALPNVLRIFRHPSRREIRLLGGIEHTPDMGVSRLSPLVDMHLPFSWVWKLFLFHPQKFQKLFDRQFWQGAFLRWYGLTPFMRFRSFIRHADGEWAFVERSRLEGLYEIPRTPVTMCRPPHRGATPVRRAEDLVMAQ